MRRNDLTVMDGKFFKDGQRVPIEFGNKEQIALLKRVNELVEEGVYPTVTEKRVITVRVECPCGNIFEFNDLELDEGDPMNCLTGSTHTCFNCKAQYKLFVDQHDDLFIKMLPKAKEEKKNE